MSDAAPSDDESYNPEDDPELKALTRDPSKGSKTAGSESAPKGGKSAFTKSPASKSGKAQDEEDGGLFSSNDNDDNDDDDDDANISVDHEDGTPSNGDGGKDAASASANTQVRGLEDSAATRRGATPEAAPRGLEDSAATRKGSAPQTMRERYAAADDQDGDEDITPRKAYSPPTNLPPKTKTTAAVTADFDAPPKHSGVSFTDEPSFQTRPLANSGDSVLSGDTDDDGTPAPMTAQSSGVDLSPVPFVARQPATAAAGDSGAPAAAPAAASKPFVKPAMLTTRYSHDSDDVDSPLAKGRVDVDNSPAQPSATQEAKRKELEGRLRAHSNLKPAAKPITDKDFASQDALSSLTTADKRTGLVLPSVLELFQTYDQDRTGAINIAEFKDMLTDLDGLSTTETITSKTKTGTKGNQKKTKKQLQEEESPEDRYLRHEFERADLNGDELISIDEFYIYFYSTLCFKFPMLRTGVNPGADLLNIYMKYCSFGKGARSEEMDCSQFAKLCHESKLLNGKTVTKATCDIVWFRARAELESLEAFKRKQKEYITPKMLYPQFLFALLYIAEKRRSGLQEVISRILKENSPLPMPSCADYIVLKNDGSPEQLEEYLLRPRGLPPAPPNPMIAELAERMRKEAILSKTLRRATYDKEPCDLSSHAHLPKHTQAQDAQEAPEANTSTSYSADEDDATLDTGRHGGFAVRAISVTGPLAHGKNVVSADKRKQWGLEPKPIQLSKHGLPALNDPEVLLEVRALKPDELIMGVRDVFKRFNLWEGGVTPSQMDKVRFVKCIRDCQLITETPGGLTQTLVDDYFAKVLPPAQNSINFMRFVDALRLVATKLRISLNFVMERLVLLDGPLSGLYEPLGGRHKPPPPDSS